MSKYSPLTRFETTFEDDTVTMNLKQLSRKTFLSWMPYLSKVERVEVDGEIVARMDEESTMKLVNEAADILPQHVLDFRGLRDVDGNAVDLATVISEVYFLPLVSEIVSKLIDIAQVQKQDEGKSAGPQLEPSRA